MPRISIKQHPFSSQICPRLGNKLHGHFSSRSQNKIREEHCGIHRWKELRKGGAYNPGVSMLLAPIASQFHRGRPALYHYRQMMTLKAGMKIGSEEGEKANQMIRIPNEPW